MKKIVLRQGIIAAVVIMALSGCSDEPVDVSSVTSVSDCLTQGLGNEQQCRAAWDQASQEHLREGSDVSIFTIDDIGNVSYQLQHEGNYSEHPKIYQQFVESLKFDGCTPMLGVWMVGPEAVGMGIREDDTLITRNNSRFIPHFWV